MGIHLTLHVVASNLDAAAWSTAYEEVATLFEAWPTGLLGLRERREFGTTLVTYSRQLRHPFGLLIVGDQASRSFGEDQRVPLVLEGLARAAPVRPVDVVRVVGGDRDDGTRTARVFGNKTQGLPYHLAVLAACMVFEDRFPQTCLTQGEFHTGDVRDARAIAEPIVGRPLPTPLALDAERLRARVAQHFSGARADAVFDELICDDSSMRAARGSFDQFMMTAMLPEVRAAAAAKTPEELAPHVRLGIEAVVGRIEPLHARWQAEPNANRDPTRLKQQIVAAATQVPTLTEEAWDRMLQEQDPSRLEYLRLILAHNTRGYELSELTRAVLEQPSLLEWGLERARDPESLATLERRLREVVARKLGL